METHIANYRIIIEPEIQKGRKVYNAYCPTLQVFDYGDSIEEVLESIRDGIQLAVESLVENGEEVPVDNLKDQVITGAEVTIPQKI